MTPEIQRCRWCKNFFYPHLRSQICCSRECRMAVKERHMAKMRIREMGRPIEKIPDSRSAKPEPLNKIPQFSADWDEIRAKILLRDAYTCQFCRATLRESSWELDVHHIVARSNLRGIPWEIIEHPSNLITLCSGCHSEIEYGHIQLSSEIVTKAYKLVKEYKNSRRSNIPSSTA